MSDVEFRLICDDEASSVVESAGARMSATFQNMQGQTVNMASVSEDASGRISNSYSTVQGAGVSLQGQEEDSQATFSDSALALNNVAAAGAGLVMGFERVENAHVQVDRANVTLQRSTETLSKAQTDYNDAVAKYGPNSAEAKDALEKLSIAQNAHQVALERVDMANRNLNNSMVMGALTVIPSLLSIINTVSHAQEIWNGLQQAGTAISAVFTGATEAEAAATETETGAQWSLNAAMDANPIGIIVLAIAGLVAAFVLAYTYCTPFRDAVNELGGALSGAFMTAVNAVRDAVSLLWNDVFKPLAVFIVDVFVANVTALVDVLNGLWNDVLVPLGNFIKDTFEAVIDAVADVFKGLWNDVLKPFGDFIQDTFGAAVKFITDLFQKLYDIVKPIVDAVNSVKDTLGGFVNTVSGALNSAGGAISNFIGSICFAHALANAADQSKTTMDGWSSMVQDHMNKSLDAIKDFNASAEIAGAPAVAGAAAAGSVPLGAAVRAPAVNNYFSGPLVQIQGSADKATAELAAQYVKESLQNVAVSPTSSSTLTRKRIRIP